MAAACPFSVGAKLTDCQRIILEDEASPWHWIGIHDVQSDATPPAALSPHRIWESDVSEIAIFVEFRSSLEKSVEGGRIAGQLRLRFVDDELVEVIFQEGSPGLLLGLSTILVPSPLAGIDTDTM